MAQSAGALTVTVHRTGGSTGAVSVAYATSNGTAVAGTDYTAADGTLNWAAGDATSKTFSVAISNATPFSGSKSFSVTLSSPSSGATLSTPSSASVAINGSSGSGGGTAPTHVQIILQGQNKQGSNENAVNTGNNTYTEPTYQTIGWYGVSGATQYNIYRSTTTTPGSNGAYSLLASVSASTAASNYSTYGSNSTYINGLGSHNIAPGINCVWQDTTSGNAVVINGTLGPTSGHYYGPTTGYTYTVTAVVDGVESAQSAPSILPLFLDGTSVFIDGIFNNASNVTLSAANPGGALSPFGFTNSVYVTLAADAPPYDAEYINPYVGSASPQYHVGITGFNYININVYPVQAWSSTDMVYNTEVGDDYNMYNPSAMILPATPAGEWTNIKLPLSTFMKMQSGAGGAGSTVGVQQVDYYKTTWGNNNGSSERDFYMEVYFSVN